jgi:hypothetical protein
MGRPSLSQRAFVVWGCFYPENVSVGPTSGRGPVQSLLLLYSLVYTRSVSLLRNRTLSLSLLLSFATAQSTAVSWFEPGPSAGSFAYAGEVLDACPGTTVLALQCTSAGSNNAMTALCGTDAPVRFHHYATGYFYIPILT